MWDHNVAKNKRNNSDEIVDKSESPDSAGYDVSSLPVDSTDNCVYDGPKLTHAEKGKANSDKTAAFLQTMSVASILAVNELLENHNTIFADRSDRFADNTAQAEALSLGKRFWRRKRLVWSENDI